MKSIYTTDDYIEESCSLSVLSQGEENPATLILPNGGIIPPGFSSLDVFVH